MLASLTAMQQPRIGPNGDGTLLRQDDERWLLLQDARIGADTARGEYRAAFGSSLARADDHLLRIAGYMMPIEAERRTSHYIITRRSTGCPFCAPPGLTEAIEIFATTPVAFTPSPVTVEGRLHLVSRSESGLFYQLVGARVV